MRKGDFETIGYIWERKSLMIGKIVINGKIYEIIIGRNSDKSASAPKYEVFGREAGIFVKEEFYEEEEIEV